MNQLRYKIILACCAFFFLSSCGMGAKEVCKTITIMSDKIRVDTLVLDHAERNRIYSTELRMKGELADTVLVNIEGVKSLQLSPGIYDSLIYKGDWYGNPMILKVNGNSGTQLEFCANFYF